MDIEFMFDHLSDNLQYVAWQEYQVRRDNTNTCAFVLLIIVHLPCAYVSLPHYIEVTVTIIAEWIILSAMYNVDPARNFTETRLDI